MWGSNPRPFAWFLIFCYLYFLPWWPTIFEAIPRSRVLRRAKVSDVRPMNYQTGDQAASNYIPSDDITMHPFIWTILVIIIRWGQYWIISHTNKNLCFPYTGTNIFFFFWIYLIAIVTFSNCQIPAFWLGVSRHYA